MDSPDRPVFNIKMNMGNIKQKINSHEAHLRPQCHQNQFVALLVRYKF